MVNPEQTYLATASDYNVGLLASNQFGCTDFSEQTVHVVEDVTFYTPTAFSPDGDSHNEVFNVKGNGIKEEGFEMQVFDRWGSLIFSTHDIKEGWNGKTPLGSYVQNGSYSWHIRFVDVFGIPHEKNGNINVIR